jgi:hypothetical protein
MVPFVPAAALKESFAVSGHFYRVRVRSRERIACRSVLEIARHGHRMRAPDAVFVMMNPGSSAPLGGEESEIHARDIASLSVSLVPAKADTTQYQLMRVMLQRGWDHVRVLNISDLREADSSAFAKRFTDLESRTRYAAHSLFAPERRAELQEELRRTRGAPLVCAWGVSPALDPLIARCLHALQGEARIGLAKPGTVDKYFHPLPSLQSGQRQWVTDLCALLT